MKKLLSFFRQHKTLFDYILLFFLSGGTVVWNCLCSQSIVGYDKMANLVAFAVLFILFVSLLCIFGGIVLTKNLSVPRAVVWTVLFAVIYFVQFILLVGFYYNDIQIPVGAVAVGAYAFLVGVYLSPIRQKKLLAVASLLLCCVLALSVGMTNTIKIAYRTKNVALNTAEDGERIFPVGVQAEQIAVYEVPNEGGSYSLFLNSLQGVLSAYGTKQVLYFERKNNTKKQTEAQKLQNDNNAILAARDKESTLALIAKYYPDCTVATVHNTASLLLYARSEIDGYIVYDPNSDESKAVALSLCNRYRSVAVTEKLIPAMEKNGWEQTYDARGMTVNQFLRTEDYRALNKNIVIMTHFVHPSNDHIIGYGVAANVWIAPLPKTIAAYRKILTQTNRNTYVFGSASYLPESCMVNTAAKYGCTFVFCTTCNNLATLSGFRLENATVPAEKENLTDRAHPTRTVGSGENKHSLCIMLSDGDNVRVSAEVNFFGNSSDVFSKYPDPENNFYQYDMMYSDRRTEEMTLTYGFSGMMAEIAPILYLRYMDELHDNEDFVMQLSSLGYTFPSKWTDAEAFDEVLKRTNAMLGMTHSSVLEIMDNDAFLNISDNPKRFDDLKPYFDKYTALSNTEGCLVIDFMNLYAGYKGAVCWSNGKPVVSAKYSLWSDSSVFSSDLNTVDGIAAAINAAPTDPSKEESYTFVIVHLWSGYDEDGNMIANGNRFEMLNDFLGKLDADVELLTATEFIRRMAENVKDRT